MNEEDLDEKLFGEILSTMMAAGASNEVLGRFAIRFRNKTIVQLVPVETEMGALLEAFASAVASKVLKAATAPTVEPRRHRRKLKNYS